MLEGLMEEEADVFLQENPTLVSLYEIDVVKEEEPFQYSADAEATVVKLDKVREALEWVLAVSQ
jgi:predicted RecB family endonuclease